MKPVAQEIADERAQRFVNILKAETNKYQERNETDKKKLKK